MNGEEAQAKLQERERLDLYLRIQRTGDQVRLWKSNLSARKLRHPSGQAMTATERPSLEARARDFGTWRAVDLEDKDSRRHCTRYMLQWTRQIEDDLRALLESVAAEERAFADTRLQTAVTTMEQATQAMLEAQAEVVELRATLMKESVPVSQSLGNLLARPQPEAILRVLRAAVAMDEGWKAWETADAAHPGIAAFTKSKAAYDAFRAAVRALPEGVRQTLQATK